MLTPSGKRSILSVYIIYSLIIMGFMGILLFDGLLDNDVAEASIIYVDSGGGAQYTSIQKAVDNANPGDTIIVANGTYNESVTINKNNINLIGNSSSECKIRHYYYGSSTSNYAAGINVTASDVNVTGFNISVSGRYTYGIRINRPAEDSFIANNNISTNGYYCYGIYVSQSTGNILVNNSVITLEYSSNGIYLDSSSNNEFIQNKIEIMDDNGYGAYLYQSSDNNLTGNSIYTYGRYSPGLYINWYSNDNNIFDNTIEGYGYGTYGIYLLQNSINNEFSNNTIYVANQGGVGVYVYSANNNKFINNTIKIFYSTVYGLYVSYTSMFTCSKNNIKYISENGSGIYLTYSRLAKLSMNNLTNCSIKIRGTQLAHWNTHTIDTFNTINSRPVYYYRNTSGFLFPVNAGELILANCSSVNITGYDISYGGVSIAFSSDSDLRENSINHNGIFLFNSYNISLIKNTINVSVAGEYGVFLSGDANNLIENTINSDILAYGGIIISGSSEYNNVRDNSINNYVENSICISLEGSGVQNNNVTHNTLNNYASRGYGIYMVYSSGNNIIGNSIITSADYSQGIYLYSSSDENEIKENNIRTFGYYSYGIYLYLGTYYNNLTKNTIYTGGMRAYGISLESGSRYNKIVKNQIGTTDQNAYGIALYTSANYNLIAENTITTEYTRGYGIYSYQSNQNEFTDNKIETSGYRGDGVYLQQSSDNYLNGNQINLSDDGNGVFLYQDSVRNELVNNTINVFTENGTGIIISDSSDRNKLTSNNINAPGKYGYGVAIEDSNNSILINCTISTPGSNATGLVLNGYFATVQDSIISTSTSDGSFDIIITNHGNISAINCTFETVQVTENGGGILRVNNYLGLQVYDLDGITPLAGIDLEVLDNGNKIYLTPGFGGMNLTTDNNGRIDKIIVPDRCFDHDNMAIENITDIKVKKLAGLDWEEERPDIDMGTSHTEVFIAYENAPPTTPTGLRVTREAGTNTLNLTWDQNFNTFNYTIYTKKTGDWYALTNITHPQNWYLDKDLIDEIEHYYKIQAWSRFGLSSDQSMPVSYYLNDITPPAIPTGLAAKPVPLGDALNISWNISLDDTVKYDLWWKESSVSTSWEQVANVSHPMNYLIFSSKLLVNGSSYIFKIRAWDKVGYSSAFSTQVSVVHRDYLAPQPPSNLNGEAVSESQVKLTWEPSPDLDVVEYHVFMNEPTSGSGGPYELIVKVQDLNLEITGLEEDTNYYFVVSALDEANNPSSYSVEAQVTTKPTPIPPKILTTIPADNSENIKVDAPVIITFNLSMDTSSIVNSITVSPNIGYKLFWNDDNKILNIVFIQNLSYDTNYTIIIDSGLSISGGVLQDVPFELNFRTEKKASSMSISILSPLTNSIVEPGEWLNVSGETSGLPPESQVKITLGNVTKTASIGVDGKWIVDIQAPDKEGNYLLIVSFNGINDTVPIIVRTPDENGDGDDDLGLFGGNAIIFGLLILIFIIIIIVIVLALVYVRKPSEKRELDEGMDRFTDEDEFGENEFEDEDWADYEYEHKAEGRGEGEEGDWEDEEEWRDEGEWKEEDWGEDESLEPEEEVVEGETLVGEDEAWDELGDEDEGEEFGETELEEPDEFEELEAEEEPRPVKAGHFKKSKAGKKKFKRDKSAKAKKSKGKTKTKAKSKPTPEPEPEEQEYLEEDEFEEVEDWDEEGLEWDDE